MPHTAPHIAESPPHAARADSPVTGGPARLGSEPRRPRSRRTAWRLGVLLTSLLWLSGCSGSPASPADAGPTVDGTDDFALPPPEQLLPPETYDCRAASSPPQRRSPAPRGCFWQPDCTEPLVVAHRGGPYFAPENTLSAFRSAIAIGADLVELDTRLTADGDLVVLHDSTVDRTTDATGEAAAYTVAEIQALPLRLPASLPASADFSCERIPTLREVLALCRGRIDVMVDVKEGAAEAAREVAAADMLDSAILLGSADELDAARAAVPAIRVMIRPHTAEEVDPLYAAYAPPPDVVHIDSSFDDPDTVAAIRDLGPEPGTPKVLINVFVEDAMAAVTGDLSGYLSVYGQGVQLAQTQFPFFPAAALGRLELP